MPIRFVYFDCMETLIQLELDGLDTYSCWAWRGAEGLGLWDGLDGFRAEWNRHRERSAAANGHREGTVLGRIRDLLAARSAAAGGALSPEEIEARAGSIHDVY